MALFEMIKRKLFPQTGALSEMGEFLSNKLKETIVQWEEHGIYAISLFVYDNCDNPCEPTVTLGYNTEENFCQQIARASDEIEAKWNYAFWLQNEEYSFGIGDTQEIVKEWIVQQGFCYYTYEEMFDSDQEPDAETYEGITEAFVRELIAVVKDLHKSGFIKNQFGKDIPVLIHELEYYDRIAEQNMEANPPEAVKDFVKFCIGE